MITKINLFSKNEHEFKVLNINNIIDDALLLLEYKLSKSKVKINIATNGETVYGDKRIISQVLMNLISNAIDALEKEQAPKITISLDTNENFYILNIQDNGPGIPEDISNNIFEPFFTTKKGAKGTGMGLATSKKILESVQSVLEFKNNNGALFRIKIPKLQIKQ